MSEKHEIWMMLVDEGGKTIGNKGTGIFRFVPRIGEHVLLPEGDGDNVFEVVDLRHDSKGMMEIWLFDLGFHLDFWRKPTKS